VKAYFCCWDEWSLNDYETLIFASSIILSKHWDQQSNWRVESFFASSHWRDVSRSRLWCQLERLDQDSIQSHLIYDWIADLVRWRKSSLFKFLRLAFLDKKKFEFRYERKDVLFTTFRRSRLRYFWSRLSWSSVFRLVRFRLRANVLTRRSLIDDVSNFSKSRMSSRNTERSKTSRFHFSVRLCLPDDIFTQNIFLISWVDSASKDLSISARDRRWSRRQNNEWSFSSSMINVFLYAHTSAIDMISRWLEYTHMREWLSSSLIWSNVIFVKIMLNFSKIELKTI